MEALKQVETLVAAKISVIRTMFSIAQLEAKLAGLSVLPLLLNLCMLLIVLMTGWLLLSALVGYGILLAVHNVPLSLFLVFLVNLGVLWGLFKYLTFNLKSMSFEKTRAWLSQNKSINDEQFEKTINRSDRNDGSDIATPPTQGDGA